jgi:protein phosphatase
VKIEKALEIVCLTDPGRRRSHNEDHVAGLAAAGLVVLADGMGGHNAGEVASDLAVRFITAQVKTCLEEQADELAADQDYLAVALRESIESANARIFATAQHEPQHAGMGTTLVAGWFYDNRLAVGHVGDSRMYRFRAGVLERLTRDHSLLQEQLDHGLISREQALHSSHRHVVTRAVGADPKVEATLTLHAVLPGDIYVLCSDGLTDMVGDEDIAATLRVMRDNPALAVKQLVRMANERGGYDNISVALVKVHGDFSVPRSLWSRLLGKLGRKQP